jgi:hypothetical protein
MLKHWNKLLNTDCTVIGIRKHVVYPIFRVGSSSLFATADKRYVNDEIGQCRHIDILIREPRERFLSGLEQYCVKNKLEIGETWHLVKEGHVIDRHFAPQFMWLMHLYKFYKGPVTLKPFEYIKSITNLHINERKGNHVRLNVTPLKEFIDVDLNLMQYYNRKVELSDLIKENKNVLS